MRSLTLAAYGLSLLIGAGCQMPNARNGMRDHLTELNQLDPRWTVGEACHSDDFDDPSLTDWRWELDKGGTIQVSGGQLDIETPAGATIWFRHELEGPVLIEYRALAVDEGGSERPSQRSELLLDGPRRPQP